MSVTLRMARHGKTKMPFYRIVAADSEMKRDGRYLELLGSVNPLVNPPRITLREDRVQYWVGVGAKATPSCSRVIEHVMPGFLSEGTAKRLAKIRARRKKRKELNAAGKKRKGVARAKKNR